MLNERDVEMLSQLEAMMDRFVRRIGEGERSLKSYSGDFHTLMRDTATLETGFRRIQKLQQTVLTTGMSRSQAVTTIQSMIKEYETLLKTMNRQGGGRFVKEINREVGNLEKALRKVKDQNDEAWDSRKIHEVNGELRTAHRNIDQIATSLRNVKVRGLRDEFRGLGEAIDSAFNGRLAYAMRRVPVLGAAIRGMELAKPLKQAHQNVMAHNQQRRDAIQARSDAAAQAAYSRYGRSGVIALRNLGHNVPIPPKITRTGTQIIPGVGRLKTTATQFREATRAATSGGGRAGSSIDQMTVGTLHADVLVVGKKSRGGRTEFNSKGRPKIQLPSAPAEEATPQLARRRWLKHAKNWVPSPAPRATDNLGIHQDVANMVGGGSGGNRLSRMLTRAGVRSAAGEGGGVMGLIGKRLMSGGAATAGEGLTSALASGAGGGLEGMTGLLANPVVAPVLGVVAATIAMHDAVARNNKSISDNLSGGGLWGNGGSVSDILSNTRSSLMSTTFGQKTLYGQNFDKNVAIFKTLQGEGMGTTRDLNRGVDLGQALDTGHGFYGAVMKNAVVNGHLNGMDQEQSIRLTLKLIEKFGKVTDATQGFFLDLTRFSNTSGISASKIVDMVDSVSDQFDDLNRSLGQTVHVLQMVGGAGMFMSKRVEDAVKTLTKPNEMTTAQRYVNNARMIKGGQGASLADSLDKQNASDLAQVNGTLQKYGTSYNGDNLGEAMGAIQRSKVDDATKRADTEALMKVHNGYGVHREMAAAYRSGNVSKVTALQEAAGESLPETIAGKVQMMRSTLMAHYHDPQKVDAILAGGTSGLARALTNMDTSLMFKQSVFGSGQNAMKQQQAIDTAMQGGAAQIAATAREGGDASTLRGGSAADQSRYRILLGAARAMGNDLDLGKPRDKASDDDYVNALLKNSKNADKVIASLTKSEWLLHEVTTGNQDITKMLDGIAQKEKQALADNTRSQESQATMQTADLFANAFTALFERVIKALEFLAFVFGDDDKIEKARKRQENAHYDQAHTTNLVQSKLHEIPVNDQNRSQMDKAWKALAVYNAATSKEGKDKAYQDLSDTLAPLGLNAKDLIYADDTAKQIREKSVGGKFDDDGGYTATVDADAAAKLLGGGGNTLLNLEQLAAAIHGRGLKEGTKGFYDLTYARQNGGAQDAFLAPNSDAASVFEKMLDSLKAQGKLEQGYTRTGNTFIINNTAVSQNPNISGEASKATPAATSVKSGG